MKYACSDIVVYSFFRIVHVNQQIKWLSCYRAVVTCVKPDLRSCLLVVVIEVVVVVELLPSVFTGKLS